MNFTNDLYDDLLDGTIILATDYEAAEDNFVYEEITFDDDDDEIFVPSNPFESDEPADDEWGY